MLGQASAGRIRGGDVFRQVMHPMCPVAGGRGEEGGEMKRTKSAVTEYDGICFFCGRPAECEHHLLFGTGSRRLAEEDGLKVPCCHRCHNMGTGTESIHGNIMAERLSRILGQAIYETRVGSREEFRARYGKSYL